MKHRIPSRLIACICCLGLVSVGSPRALVAQERTPDQTEKEAEAAALGAKAAFKAGKFEEAARKYMEAYGLVQKPTLVFNAARAYEEAGRLEEALPLFRLYLNVDKGTDDNASAGRDDARKRIARIERTLAQLKPKADPRPIEDRPRPDPKPLAKPDAKPDAKPEGTGPRPDVKSKGTPARPKVEGTGPERPGDKPDATLKAPGQGDLPAAPGRTMRIAGWSALGAGVVALAAGAFFWGKAGSLLTSLDDDLEAGKTTPDGLKVHPGLTQVGAQARLDEVNGKRRWAVVWGSVGLGAAAAGLVALLAAPDAPAKVGLSPRALLPVPVLQAGGAGLAWEARF